MTASASASAMRVNAAGVVAAVIALSFAAAGCGSSVGDAGATTKSRSRTITREELGDQWPFTVDEGVVACDEIGMGVTFTANGTTYAVNGFGKGADIDPIWVADPSGLNPKMSIGPLIEAGLELCP